jgi:hypothetical protein
LEFLEAWERVVGVWLKGQLAEGAWVEELPALRDPPELREPLG